MPTDVVALASLDGRCRCQLLCHEGILVTLSIAHFGSHAADSAVSDALVILPELHPQLMHQVPKYWPRGCWTLHVDARVALSHQWGSKHHAPQAHLPH